MTLWRPAVRSELPLEPFWRTLGRMNYGGDLYRQPDGWHVVVDRLRKVRGEWVKDRVYSGVHGDEYAALRAAVAQVPGISGRLALIASLCDA